MKYRADMKTCCCETKVKCIICCVKFLFVDDVCSYRNDVWLWNLDWSTKKVKLPQTLVV